MFHTTPPRELRILYRFDLTTGETSLVVEARARYAGVWSPQGKWFAYDSAERNGRDRDLYVIQPSDPKTKRRLAELKGRGARRTGPPTDNTLLVNEIFGNSETYLWRVDVKTGERSR